MVVVQTFIVIFLLGVLVTMLTKPVYRTTARILVEGKSLTLSQVNANDPLSGLFTPSAGYDVGTQIEVLQSDKLLEEAYAASGLSYSKNKLLSQVVSLKVKQVLDTNVIEISADSNDPDAAARLARNIPLTYLNYITGDRKTEVTKALAFAKARLKEESDHLDRAAAALERYKSQAKVVNLDAEQARRTARLAGVEGDLDKAKAAVASATARLQSLEAARGKLPEFLETPVTTSNITQIDLQKDRLSQLRGERAKKLEYFTVGSPEIRELDAQIKELQTALDATPKTVTNVTRATNPAILTYEDKLSEARATLAGAQKDLDETTARNSSAKANLDAFNAIERQQAPLQREMEQRQNSVNMLAKSVEDLQLREKATHDPVLTITPAAEAVKVAPKLSTNLVLASMLGLMLGVAFAMLQEYLDDRINAPEEARLISGLPALGFIPFLEKSDERMLIQAKNRSLLENYRMLRSNVQFATINKTLTALQVTSSTPGEGKSTTACNLAITMAMDERRVILVDADLRRPTVHRNMNLNLKPGLTSVLLHQVSLKDALQETNVTNLRVLTAGAIPPNPAEILNSALMKELIEELKTMADIVVFDSPPTLVTADAQVLAANMDGILYVVNLGETKRTSLRQSMEMMTRANANVIGAVFNKVDFSESKGYYYYGYNGYYGTSPAIEGSVVSNGSPVSDDDPIEVALTPLPENSRKESSDQ